MVAEGADERGYYKDCAHGRPTHTRVPPSKPGTGLGRPKPVFRKVRYFARKQVL